MKIRHASINDLDLLAEIEAASFPDAEAASKDNIKQRLEVFPNHFWLMENDQNEIISAINGLVAKQKKLTDAMYDHAEMHDPKGEWQMIFSVATSPKYRHHGYASKLMNQVIADVKSENRSGIVLTCKEKLISFYAQFGFQNEGLSKSTHGNVQWHQMRLKF